MTAEELALAKAAGLERNPAERARMLRDLDRTERDRAALTQTTQLRDGNQNCREMTRAQYARFKRAVSRALLGVPPG